MQKPLWTPSQNIITQANISKFIQFVNESYSLKVESYRDLHSWSIKNITDFWESIWGFTEVIASTRYEKIVDDLTKFPGAKWFSGAKLNFAQNLLRFNDDRLALISKNELGRSVELTFSELNGKVGTLAKSLRSAGVRKGDTVCAYMPNTMETVVAMLAATSIGAIWSSCGVELGTTAVLDRLGQISPKILFTVDGYSYNGKIFDRLPLLEKVSAGIPSLQLTVVVPYLSGAPKSKDTAESVDYEQFLSLGEERKDKSSGLVFEQLPFDHPVYIMFSSGTTGKPKCMVQGAGGVLLNHLKELILHTDLKREDRIIYITSPSWMMWNWLVSSLAVGATIVLYDGNPGYPDWGAMWEMIQKERATIFGCSASYINYLRTVDARPGRNYDLSSLREISQTGSSLSAEGFEWIYREVKQDLHFNSISGGTDINGCFAIGCPILPVYAGEIQASGLGMKIKAYDERGDSIVDQMGELVCEAPSPSMPLYFWNDSSSEKYIETYFNFYRSCGKNVWRHGDYILIHGDTGGITFYGRSDAVLKPSGVRIGASEIYNVLEDLSEIDDSLAVGQCWKGDQRIILFVKLSPTINLTEDLKSKIRTTLRERASPRHVPALIFEVPDIPYTFNMKKVESAVTNIVNGSPVVNKDALINPESLGYFEKLIPKLGKSIT